MINIINKIKNKILKTNIYNFLIKLGKQKKSFLKNQYLLKNCLINTWIKIIKKKKKFFFFGYSNSLIISSIIKIINKIINNNTFLNIFIFLKYNCLKIIKIKNIVTNIKQNNLINILNHIKFKLKYN
ncbi:SufE family protein [Candidatus Carsonella ruddii]|uniref:SufE protein probably involved in Fe-S center assembly n=1 Tax=Candidatus Carsonella ruddii PC isolate NHV TaxID=1202540 RepID=J3TEQ2_CARRU|nr:SufE family protein [Candidatus Carsonella ruddii]AFP84312.1 SufE protein probably involved in Fe-S center assembly [Candidatus Carsonella ruddii PC isolate NHV]